MDFAQHLIDVARSYLHVRELPLGSNSNDSPEIRTWLEFVGINTPSSYCAAYACYCVHRARLDLNVDVTFNKSASALHLVELNPDSVVTGPLPGDLVVFDHGQGKGHVAIVTNISQPTSIAGNTSPDGTSREGTGVFEHSYDPKDPKIRAYLRVGVAA